MKLVVALPHRIAVQSRVFKVSAEGTHGTFTLLPHHLDYVVLLEPGILTYAPEDQVGLERTVVKSFRRLDERERTARAAMSRIESRVLHEMFESEDDR